MNRIIDNFVNPNGVFELNFDELIHVIISKILY